jgi:hypothetical protein
MYRALNGGEVWGNPLMAPGPLHWGPPRPGDHTDSYNRSLQHYDGAWDEAFGALNTLDVSLSCEHVSLLRNSLSPRVLSFSPSSFFRISKGNAKGEWSQVTPHQFAPESGTLMRCGRRSTPCETRL